MYSKFSTTRIYFIFHWIYILCVKLSDLFIFRKFGIYSPKLGQSWNLLELLKTRYWNPTQKKIIRSPSNFWISWINSGGWKLFVHTLHFSSLCGHLSPKPFLSFHQCFHIYTIPHPIHANIVYLNLNVKKM